MNPYSRRDFLVSSAAAAGALAVPGSLLAAEDKQADMAIARWSGAKDEAAAAKLSAEEMTRLATKMTEDAILALGGMKRFVKKGDIVWIKPNIGWDRTPEQAGNTNPDVVATLIRLCQDAGAKAVKVGDYTCDKAPATYERSQIAPISKKMGAEVIFMDKNRFRETTLPGAERLKSIPIYPELIECDLVINVPLVKHHVLAELTMCMKNYMGVVEERKKFHQDIPTCLADITRYMKPRLCVLDAMRILTAHGPKGGNLADVKMKMTIAAGVDIVALDAWGAEVAGKEPAKIKSVAKGAEVGLGKIDYRSLALKELSVS